MSSPPRLPEGFTLVEGLLTPEEGQALLARLVAELPWEDHVFRIFGRVVPMPRRIAWFGPRAYAYSGVEHPARPLPPLLAGLRARVEAAVGLPFDAVLANLYRDGRDSMGWHADDDYAGPHPVIASLSLGAPRRFCVRARTPPRAPQSFVLPHGSLLVMGEGTQARTQHALPRAPGAGVRVNLTWRALGAPLG